MFKLKFHGYWFCRRERDIDGAVPLYCCFLHVSAQLLSSCPTLCDPLDWSLPGFSVHGILQEDYWSGLPFHPPRDLLDPGIKPASFASPALAGEFFTTDTTWETPSLVLFYFTVIEMNEGWSNWQLCWHNPTAMNTPFLQGIHT